MSSLSMVLNTAREALAAQQVGLNVTGHNIANVNTEHYSRQTAVFENRDPLILNGLVMGTGATVEDIVRSTDQLLENRLLDQRSALAGYDEAESYMAVLETLFNEDSENSLSSQISDFWNAWHDVSNMPAGIAQRTAVYDAGVRLTEQFGWLNENMYQMQRNLEAEVRAGVTHINSLAEQIAAFNVDIISAQATSNPNDQLDQRNALVTELAELIDIKTYVQPNGSLSVSTNTGHMLVYESDSFELQMQSGQVSWIDSQGSAINITDLIKGGQMGGWLEMRDEIIPKYRQDLDSLAGEIVWSVNLQHSKGVGLDFYSTPMTGAYQTDATQMLDTLAFGDRIDYSAGSMFKMWVSDSSGASPVSVEVDMSTVVPRDLPTFAAAFNTAANAALGAGNMVASVTVNNELTFTPAAGYQFAFSDDQVQDSGLVAALGFNTFFTGETAVDIEVNSVLQDNRLIAVGQIDGNTGDSGVGDNRNAMAIADIQYASQQIDQWTVVRGQSDSSQSINATIEGYYQGMIGSMGIKSASITRNAEFNQIMVEKITEQRDSISGVNLDEEMINLIKFQQGYAAASKLITVADEMLQALLSAK